ncbi:MAG: UDP-N-acetylglucosamine diphosphorylase/glucosamine-1-phosphate N-acetyltransferase [Deltaproteobacteria bacterium CG11_big_fil_rev_8_21_14_0_20_49_13]|nr:MAG: UDP-N-acetylglucosamine diphosphorylase/glucosamine-1-phosphate N-acetyltransferase [Deltaproteobacteria bacterium CG11_big_fil_rev_8_21_14_0_20_49_13]
MQNTTAVVLAAGKSTRMKSTLPKVLHLVSGRPLVTYPVRSCLDAGAGQVIVVISEEQKGRFTELFGDQDNVSLTVQKEQLGTADAVRSAENPINKESEYIVIIPGDVPLIRPETLKKLITDTHAKEAICGLLTMDLKDPASYGRILRDNRGMVTGIKEAKDASPPELMVREVNSGIYYVKKDWLFESLKKISPKNAQKEFYLTDIIEIASKEGKRVSATCIKEHEEVLGVNTRIELAEVNRHMRYRILDKMMLAGVGIVDELHTYIDDGVEIGADTVIYPHAFISGKTKIGKGCRIENGAVIKNMKIGDNVKINAYSYIEEGEIKDNATIGPFARLRPGVLIENEAKVGNFVEIKKSTLKKGSKANHLSYIGDAVIGERTNVGCGMITCNYDGKEKHKTTIGNDVFIGSDVQLVAPVEIGNNSTIAAGSTITESVPENSLAIARSRQVIKGDWKSNK